MKCSKFNSASDGIYCMLVKMIPYNLIELHSLIMKSITDIYCHCTLNMDITLLYKHQYILYTVNKVLYFIFVFVVITGIVKYIKHKL